MVKLKFLPILFFLLIIGIAKADGCGIVCPKTGTGTLIFGIKLLCNFGTWVICHVFTLVAFIICIAVVWFYFYRMEEDKRKTVFLGIKICIGILILVLFYEPIKALMFTSPFITTTPPDSCSNPDTTNCILSDTGEQITHTPYYDYNYWKVTCPATGIAEIKLTSGTGIIQNTSGVVCVLNDCVMFVDSYEYANVTVSNFTYGSPYTITHWQCSS